MSKTAEQKELEGNRGHRDINPGPKSDIDFEDAPADLGVVAREEWRRAGGLLREQGVLTKLDRMAFRAYCEYYERWMLLQEKVRAELESGKSLAPNSLIYVEMKVHDKLLKLQKEFGMTPIARQKISVDKPDGDDDWNELLEKRV